jgi:hypothetical protein
MGNNYYNKISTPLAASLNSKNFTLCNGELSRFLDIILDDSKITDTDYQALNEKWNNIMNSYTFGQVRDSTLNTIYNTPANRGIPTREELLNALVLLKAKLFLAKLSLCDFLLNIDQEVFEKIIKTLQIDYFNESLNGFTIIKFNNRVVTDSETFKGRLNRDTRNQLLTYSYQNNGINQQDIKYAHYVMNETFANHIRTYIDTQDRNQITKLNRILDMVKLPEDFYVTDINGSKTPVFHWNELDLNSDEEPEPKPEKKIKINADGALNMLLLGEVGNNTPGAEWNEVIEYEDGVLGLSNLQSGDKGGFSTQAQNSNKEGNKGALPNEQSERNKRGK